jgi:hypothetical protein
MASKIFPVAFIFSDTNPLAQKLSQELSSLGLQVTIFTWVTSELHKDSTIDPDYIIFISSSCFNAHLDSGEGRNLTLVRRLAMESRAKTLFVFPYRQKENIVDTNAKLTDEIFSKDLSHSSVNFIGDLMPESSKVGEWAILNELPKDRVLYPLDLNEGVKLLIKNLFSLQSYSKKLQSWEKHLKYGPTRYLKDLNDTTLTLPRMSLFVESVLMPGFMTWQPKRNYQEIFKNRTKIGRNRFVLVEKEETPIEKENY